MTKEQSVAFYELGIALGRVARSDLPPADILEIKAELRKAFGGRYPGVVHQESGRSCPQ